MQRLSGRFFVAATAGALTLAQTAACLALPAAPLPERDAGLVQVRGGWHGGGAVARPGWTGGSWRGGAYRPPGGWYGRPVARPPAYVGGWRRPYYGWRPGGAIAAGAAIGFLSAAAAAAYATSAAPAPGLCWYYTDATYQAGFWDYCP
ncbi:hypothetical protein ACNHKD_15645 [Methylocystis sp. JAN1]|uniref:hypothetical protein n=1 Tax=Methylocystis sp. JAN1 TaxID=3397211 RepID=UPI003FA2DF81